MFLTILHLIDCALTLHIKESLKCIFVFFNYYFDQFDWKGGDSPHGNRRDARIASLILYDLGARQRVVILLVVVLSTTQRGVGVHARILLLCIIAQKPATMGS